MLAVPFSVHKCCGAFVEGRFDPCLIATLTGRPNSKVAVYIGAFQKVAAARRILKVAQPATPL